MENGPTNLKDTTDKWQSKYILLEYGHQSPPAPQKTDMGPSVRAPRAAPLRALYCPLLPCPTTNSAKPIVNSAGSVSSRGSTDISSKTEFKQRKFSARHINAASNQSFPPPLLMMSFNIPSNRSPERQLFLIRSHTAPEIGSACHFSATIKSNSMHFVF